MARSPHRKRRSRAAGRGNGKLKVEVAAAKQKTPYEYGVLSDPKSWVELFDCFSPTESNTEQASPQQQQCPRLGNCG